MLSLLSLLSLLSSPGWLSWSGKMLMRCLRRYSLLRQAIDPRLLRTLRLLSVVRQSSMLRLLCKHCLLPLQNLPCTSNLLRGCFRLICV